MENRISLSELEALIRKNINDRGITNKVTEEQVAEIKNKLKNRLSLPSSMFHTTMVPRTEYDVDTNTGLGASLGDAVTGDFGGGMEEDVNNTEDDLLLGADITPENSDEALNYSAPTMPPAIDSRTTPPGVTAVGLEGLNSLDQQSDQPQTTPGYEPRLPDFIEKAEPEKIFIHNENELSVGAETLRTLPFHLVNSPEEKMSMEDMWLQKAKVRAEVYKIDFVKIGELVFRPNDGICKFERTPQSIPAEVPEETQLDVQQAIQSQETNMPDAIDPVMDVTLPMTNDMGLQNPDIQKATMEVIEKALRHYLMNKNNDITQQ